MFFVFDGVDGAGKSTQLEMFVQWLAEQGHDVVTCSDPGSTELGEQIRAILLGKHETPISMRAEMMLFTTARTQLIQQVIKPALALGQTVVLDRYIFSTVVYQGHAGDLASDDIWSVNRIATENHLPDATFILDVPVDIAMSRLGKTLDRMESRGNEYFERVRNGFLLESERWPDTVDVIDATRDPNEIQSDIRKLAIKYINRQASN
ncbi:MAG: dTMP kinase [Mariniblastus sp.]|jgi:dTMP kinase|nr:dTMP kinase [Mariniblastus sp.]|tara:strand:+ start:868 stop:1488 length:621 start_codon:yes stop_codon:yes gene_type:complete